jgi:GR25 family glycosyltransferase involved in LPS biosynthesis
MQSKEVSIFCLSHKNIKRRDNLKRIFSERGLEANFYDGVGPDDPRIHGRPLDVNTRRAWSIMYGHLDMLRLFLDTEAQFGIFCEDDILIRRDFGIHLPQIVENFKELKLDVLLLGNLCSNQNFRYCSNFPERPTRSVSDEFPFKYYAYDSNPESAVWGTQMYMLHRDQVQCLLQKYADGYSDKTISDKSLVHFSADWTITKEGTKAIIYPLVAIENYESEYEDSGQNTCRKKCHHLFYSEEIFGI